MTLPGKKRVRIQLVSLVKSDPHSLSETAAIHIHESLNAQGVEIIDSDILSDDEAQSVAEEVLETQAKPHVVASLKQVEVKEAKKREEAGVEHGKLFVKPPEQIVSEVVEAKNGLSTVLSSVCYAMVSAVLDFIDKKAKGQ